MRSGRVATWTAAIALVIVCAVWLFPFLYLVLASFKSPAEFFTPGLLPSSFDLSAYERVLGDPKTLVMLRNSLIVATLTTIVSVILGTLCAYGLHQLKLRAWIVGLVVFVLMFFRFYPRIAMVVPFFVIMRDLGLFDTAIAVVLGHLGITIPFVTWLMLITFNSLPEELDEAAQIDGASRAQRFLRVSLPLAATGIATSAVLTAVLSWNEFLIAQSLTRSSNPVLSTGVASFITDAGVQLGPMAALSVIICLPIVIFALLLQRFFVAGMTVGAVKG